MVLAQVHHGLWALIPARAVQEGEWEMRTLDSLIGPSPILLVLNGAEEGGTLLKGQIHGVVVRFFDRFHKSNWVGLQEDKICQIGLI